VSPGTHPGSLTVPYGEERRFYTSEKGYFTVDVSIYGTGYISAPYGVASSSIQLAGEPEEGYRSEEEIHPGYYYYAKTEVDACVEVHITCIENDDADSLYTVEFEWREL